MSPFHLCEMEKIFPLSFICRGTECNFLGARIYIYSHLCKVSNTSEAFCETSTNKMVNKLNQLITKKPVDGTKEYARLLKDVRQIKLGICSAQQQHVPHSTDPLGGGQRSQWCHPGPTATPSAKTTTALFSLMDRMQAAGLGSRPVPGSSLHFGGGVAGQHRHSVCALRRMVLEHKGELWISVAWGLPRLTTINLALKRLLNTAKKQQQTSLPT